MSGFARPTLKDVAALCGVSEISVSRVMRGAPNISASMRERVLEAANTLDYTPNRLAGALASSATKLLAVIVPSMNHSVFPEVLDGIDSVLAPTPYRTVLGITHYDKEREAELVGDLLAWNPAGVIIAGFEHTPGCRRLLERFSNTVIEIMDADGEPIDASLGVSHDAAGRLMAEHLVERGYRKIAYVGAWNERPTRSKKRRLAFETRLAELGHRLTAHLIEPAESSLALGKQSCAKLLDSHPDTEAIFFANDDLVAGALLHCLQVGIDVPGRLALAGFNALPVLDAMPLRITTIETPRFSMGTAAADLFLSRLRGEDNEFADSNGRARKVVMPARLVLGETT